MQTTIIEPMGPQREPLKAPIPELERLRIQVAHLSLQVAQLQTQIQLQPLIDHRDQLIRHTLLAYVAEDEIEQYVIDLDAGLVRPRDHHAE